MFDLDPWVDLNEVVTTHLVHQKLCSSGIPISHALCKLDSVSEDALPNFFWEVCCGRNLHDFLMPPLDGTITFEQVDRVTLPVSQ